MWIVLIAVIVAAVAAWYFFAGPGAGTP